LRIHVLSDLHLGFGAFVPPRPAADVVVLAGDVDTGQRGFRWVQQAWDATPVIYVPGNHEYYGEALPQLTAKLQAAGADWPVRVLERSAVVLDGVRFLGCTLWTDLALYGNPYLGGLAVADVMADFRTIRVSPTYRRFRPGDAAALHRVTLRWLAEEFSQSDLPTVVVSHHAPSAQSLDPRFAADPTNAGYASALDELIARWQPVAWIHGHVHRSVDYVVGRTRVVCNPRGYADEAGQGFDPALVITV
jgi:predicted phosphohydrolase